MAQEMVIRKVLESSGKFKMFWQEKGPFKYALTSREFPPVLLEEEEWLFSNDVTALLKELMQYGQQRMKIVKSPFNPANKAVLRPDDLSKWKIANFPEAWNSAKSDLFTPEGHLTAVVMESAGASKTGIKAASVERAFFSCLEKKIGELGYILFVPREGAKRAAVQSYLKEWEADEADAGLL